MVNTSCMTTASGRAAIRMRTWPAPRIIFAARLQQQGIGRGDRIILWSENRPAWVAAFWGCVLRGVAVAPIDEHHSIEFLERVERITTPKAIVVGDEMKLPPRADGTPVASFRSRLDHGGRACRRSSGLPRRHGRDPLHVGLAMAASQVGVVITHRNILANIVPVEGEVMKYVKYARPFSPIRFLNLPPLSHMFGQAMAIFIPPMLSGTVIFQRSQASTRDHPADHVAAHLRAGIGTEDPGRAEGVCQRCGPGRPWSRRPPANRR